MAEEVERKLGELKCYIDLKRNTLAEWARKGGTGGPRHWQGLGAKKVVVLDEEKRSDPGLLEDRRPDHVVTIWDQSGDRTRPLPSFVVGLCPLPQDHSGPRTQEKITKLIMGRVEAHPWVSKIIESHDANDEGGHVKSASSVLFKLLGGAPSGTWLHMHATTRKERLPYCPISLTSPSGILTVESLGLYQQFCGHLCGWIVDENSEELLKSSGITKALTPDGMPMAAHDPEPDFTDKLPTLNRKQSQAIKPEMIQVSVDSGSDQEEEETEGGHHGTI